MTRRGSAAPAVAAPRGRRGAWWWQWLAVTAGAALVVTVVDAVLLQARRDFFTGGFLAADHVTSPAQAVGFLLAAFVIDFALLGIITALALVAGARMGLSRWAGAVAALACALVPVALANLVEYQLASYLG